MQSLWDIVCKLNSPLKGMQDSMPKRRFGKNGDNLGESIKKEIGMKELTNPVQSKSSKK